MSKRRSSSSSTTPPRTAGRPEAVSSPQPAVVGPVTELRRVGRNATATADELRTFLRQLRGRSPKEMLGTVASSSLFRSLVMSTIGAGALLAILTVVPYAWHRTFGSEASDHADRNPPAAGTNDPPSPPDASPAAPPTAILPDTGSQPEADPVRTVPGEAIERLGIGDRQPAPANVNPLEDSHDDLLEGLD